MERCDHGQKLNRRGGGGGGGGTTPSSSSKPDFSTTTCALSSGEVTGIARGIDGVGAGDGLTTARAGWAFPGGGVGVFAGRADFFFVFALGVELFFALDLCLVDFLAPDFFILCLG